MTDKDFLEALELQQTFEGMHPDDIKLLVETWGLEEAKLFYKIDKSKGKKRSSYYLDHLEIDMSRLCIGIRRKSSGKSFQVTNHTLYTILREYDKKPSDLEKIKGK